MGAKHSPAYEAILRAGARVKPLKQVHAHLIVSGSACSRSLLTKLLTLTCAARSIDYTRLIFSTVPEPDEFLFNSLITSTSKSDFPLESLFYYRRMILANLPPCNYTFTAVIKSCAALSARRAGKEIHCHVLIHGYGTDSFVQAALVAFYSKSGDPRIARKVFDGMPKRTVVAWNSMISGYEQNGLAKEAIGVFNLMRDLSVEPDTLTFVSLLSACAQMGDRSLGCWVHDSIIRKGFDVNVVLGTALINMYSRCGDVSKAREVFDSIKEKNVVAWTAMISGYGSHGFGKQAVHLLHEMRRHGPRPNNITLVAVLSACAHAGLVDEGRAMYASLSQESELITLGVEHHVCMVDMFGRAGFLDEAYKFIEELGSKEPVAPAVWTAMLGACKKHKNFDLGVKVAEQLLSIQPENPGHYVMLSNIYASAGKMDRVETVRNIMIKRCLKKQVGYSVIEVDQETYLFSMGDRTHPESNEIYRYLDDLMGRCGEAGYVAVPEAVMHQLEEEEREFALRYHSEKLAIAFGLLKTSHGTAIRVVKNLRMCEDCHSAIKFMSSVTNREIVVRDKLRFHHFKDGTCSCLDYW